MQSHPEQGRDMLDTQSQPRLQRSQGEARLVLSAQAGRPRISRLSQAGSAKVMLTSRTPDEAVFLNTAGGLTGGDRLLYALHLGPGLHLTATTQTAERAYASLGDIAEAEVDLRVEDGASLDWLPQETLIYERSRLRRRIRVSLGEGARLLLAETLVLGRHAMGEAPTRAELFDLREVSRDQRPIWVESLRIDPASLARQFGPAILGGARCLSTIALIAPDAPAHLGRLQDLLAADGVEIAASGWRGRLILRLVSRDLWPLRLQVAHILARLRGKPVPRVWQLYGDIA